MWAGAFKGSHISGRVRRIQRLGSKYMVVDFDAEVSGVRELPPGSPAGANTLRATSSTSWKNAPASGRFCRRRIPSLLRTSRSNDDSCLFRAASLRNRDDLQRFEEVDQILFLCVERFQAE